MYTMYVSFPNIPGSPGHDCALERGRESRRMIMSEVSFLAVHNIWEWSYNKMEGRDIGHMHIAAKCPGTVRNN